MVRLVLQDRQAQLDPPAQQAVPVHQEVPVLPDRLGPQVRSDPLAPAARLVLPARRPVRQDQPAPRVPPAHQDQPVQQGLPAQQARPAPPDQRDLQALPGPPARLLLPDPQDLPVLRALPVLQDLRARLHRHLRKRL